MAEILAARGNSVEATLTHAVSWSAALKRAIRSGRELCHRLELPSELASAEAERDFPVFVPHEYLSRMRVGDATDPLLRQVLASHAETSGQAAGVQDPVGDLSSVRLPGLLHKYDRRVLLITTGACAVHCRYCFRRHFPYDTAPKSRDGWQQALDVIADDDSIDEVILSGGDPLTLTDASLSWLVSQINGISHIRRLRLHTRLPVVIPQRVCGDLLEWISTSRTALYVVLHFNHAQEIDASVETALAALRRAGATLLNQAVLLRQINDSLAAQSELCLRLVDQHVLPYYLHQLDPVQGGMHYQVADEEALQIVDGLRSQLPGYAVPRLVREIAGQPSKTLIR